MSTATMATGRFKPATRSQIKLRMAIDGPSGSGKTYTALAQAHALAGGKRIAVIDSESGSASKYAGENGWQFDVLELTTFSPSEYAAAINEAGRLGYDVIVVDSLSHAWEGKDGALELKDKKGGNSFTAWKDITPMHRAMVDAILTSPAHVIATMRSKTEYVLEVDSNGKQVPKKVGMAPIQRQGMEYEFDVYLSMDWSHIATVTKSRCRSVDGMIVAKPGAAFMDPIKAWLTTGTSAANYVVIPPARISDEQLQAIAAAANTLGWKVPRVEKELPSRFAVTALLDLSQPQADELLKWLAGQQKAAEARAATAKAKANGAAATQPAAAQPQTNGVAPAAAPATTTPTIVDNAPASHDPSDGKLHKEQLEAIVQVRAALMKDHGLTLEQYRAALGKRGVETAADLTVAQADELIAAMRGKLQKAQNGVAKTPPAPLTQLGASPN